MLFLIAFVVSLIAATAAGRQVTRSRAIRWGLGTTTATCVALAYIATHLVITTAGLVVAALLAIATMVSPSLVYARARQQGPPIP